MLKILFSLSWFFCSSTVFAQIISPEQFTAWVSTVNTSELSKNWTELDLGRRRSVVESLLHRQIVPESFLLDRLQQDLERLSQTSKTLPQGAGFYADELARIVGNALPKRARWARACFHFIVWRELQAKPSFNRKLLDLDRRIEGRVSLSAVLALQELSNQAMPLGPRQAYALAEGGFDEESIQLLSAKQQVSFIEHALQLKQRPLDKEYYLKSLPAVDYQEIRTQPAHPVDLMESFHRPEIVIDQLSLTQSQLLRVERLQYAYRSLLLLQSFGAKPAVLEALRPSPELTQAWFTHYPSRVESFFRQLRDQARGRDLEWLLRPLAFEMSEMANTGGFALLRTCFLGSPFLQSESLQKILFSGSMSEAFAYEILARAKTGKKLDFELARVYREAKRYFSQNLNGEQISALNSAFEKIKRKPNLDQLGFDRILTPMSSGPFDCGSAMSGP